GKGGGTGGGVGGGGGSGGGGGGGIVSGTRLVSVGSNGWTVEAEALVPKMIERAQIFVHTGDLDFSFSDLNQACARWPNLAHYCANGAPANTPDQIRAGYK